MDDLIGAFDAKRSYRIAGQEFPAILTAAPFPATSADPTIIQKIVYKEILTGNHRANVFKLKYHDDRGGYIVYMKGGDDTAIFNGDANMDGFINGGAGFDTVVANFSGTKYISISDDSWDSDRLDFAGFETKNVERFVIRGQTIKILGNEKDDNIQIAATVLGRLEGQTGNDTLSAQGGGWIRLYGEEDDDLLIMRGEGAAHGGDGTDTFSVEGAKAAYVITLNTLAWGTSYRAKNPGAALIQLYSIENLRGGMGNDKLIGNARANHLFGGAGNDTLQGGVGNDTLHGGSGRDRIILHSETGDDLVVGFNRSEDTLMISRYHTDGETDAATVISTFAVMTPHGMKFDFGPASALIEGKALQADDLFIF